MRLWDEHWSEGVIKQAVWLGGLVDSERAAQVLEQVGGISISDSTIWRLCQRWGEHLGKLEAAQWAVANSERLGSGYGYNSGYASQPMKMGTSMGTSMDGAMVHIRDEEWKELKVGCVFDIEQVSLIEKAPEPGEMRTMPGEMWEGSHATNQSYVAHLGGPEGFGQALWGEAHRRGWERADHTEVLADGAPWIWNLAAEHFYDSAQLVDWYHGAQHLALVSEAVHESNANTSAAPSASS